MSTLEQEDVNVLDNQPIANEQSVEDIINEQAGLEEPANTQEVIEDSATSINYEEEAKKFQSMYDRSQAENAKLQQGAQILQLLEQRPDLVQSLEDGIANPPSQKSNEPPVNKDDFNPWDAFTNDDSESGRYVNKKINNTVDQIVSERLARQQQQMESQMQMQNTVNELRGTYKMSDNDINDFLQFTTQPKEQVGLNNLVKLWQMQNGQSVANNDTMEAVNAAKQAPRTAGVLQGQSEPNKSDGEKMWDSIVRSGGRNNVL
mgnify:FL=1|tara:strand:- start:258 stop:1040 length:783 start_codon:yes stop_codon:yes gene_type:complete